MSEVASEITKLVDAREAKTAELTKTSLTKDMDSTIKKDTGNTVSDFKAFQEQRKPTFDKKVKF